MSWLLLLTFHPKYIIGERGRMEFLENKLRKIIYLFSTILLAKEHLAFVQ